MCNLPLPAPASWRQCSSFKATGKHLIVSKILMTTLRGHAVQSFAFKFTPRSSRNKFFCLVWFFQFLQKGTLLWLNHYEKCSISSKILSHTILVHNKKSFKHLQALILQLLLLLMLVDWFFALPSTDIICMSGLAD